MNVTEMLAGWVLREGSEGGKSLRLHRVLRATIPPAFIAWIRDAGRKIQEEQELTV